MDTLRESAMATKTFRSANSGRSHDTAATGRTDRGDDMEMKIIGALNDGVIQNRKQIPRNLD